MLKAKDNVQVEQSCTSIQLIERLLGEVTHNENMVIMIMFIRIMTMFRSNRELSTRLHIRGLRGRWNR